LIGTSSLAFIKSHTLMEYTVDSLDGVPIFYTKQDVAASRLAVMYTARYTLLFIGSSKCSQFNNVTVYYRVFKVFT